MIRERPSGARRWRPRSSPADLVLLTLFLNPSVTLRKDAARAARCRSSCPTRLAGTLAPVVARRCWPRLVIGWPRGARARRSRGCPGSPRWRSSAAAAAAALFWLNLVSLPPLAARSSRAAARWPPPPSPSPWRRWCCSRWAWTRCCFPTRGRGVSAALVVLAAAAAVVMPLAARPAPRAARHARARWPPRPSTPLRRVVLVGDRRAGPGAAAGRAWPRGSAARLRADAAARRPRPAGHAAPHRGAADLDHDLHRPPAPRPRREELRRLPPARVGHRLRAAAQGRAGGAAGARGAGGHAPR